MEQSVQRTQINSVMAKAVASKRTITASQHYAINVTRSWIRARIYQKLNGKNYGNPPIEKR
jgi:hypothetical protein